jgi:hypothetical protein
MPSSSSKGKPTDQKLHDKITEEVKQQTNKDGESLGQAGTRRGITAGGWNETGEMGRGDRRTMSCDDSQ